MRDHSYDYVKIMAISLNNTLYLNAIPFCIGKNSLVLFAAGYLLSNSRKKKNIYISHVLNSNEKMNFFALNLCVLDKTTAKCVVNFVEQIIFFLFRMREQF